MMTRMKWCPLCGCVHVAGDHTDTRPGAAQREATVMLLTAAVLFMALVAVAAAVVTKVF